MLQTYHFVHEHHVSTVSRENPKHFAVLLSQGAQPFDELEHESASKSEAEYHVEAKQICIVGHDPIDRRLTENASLL